MTVQQGVLGITNGVMPAIYMSLLPLLEMCLKSDLVPKIMMLTRRAVNHRPVPVTLMQLAES